MPYIRIFESFSDCDIYSPTHFFKKMYIMSINNTNLRQILHAFNLYV